MQSSINTEAHQLLQQGVEALRAGNKEQALYMIARSLQMNPSNDQGWLWLSGAVATDAERRHCLEQAVALNPHNQAAQRGLAALGAAEASGRVQAPPAANLPSVGGTTLGAAETASARVQAPTTASLPTAEETASALPLPAGAPASEGQTPLSTAKLPPMPSENMPAPAMDQMRSALVPSARKPRLLPILLAVAVVIVIIIVVVLGSVFMS